ncbi:MAG TPA: C39 family peptidase [Ktedonobacterales bacterium]|nr:C39 family peptidase [Ktedonobacterales bacterium]
MTVAQRFPTALRRAALTAPAILPGRGLPARARVRVDTRALVHSAASPWNGARFVLALMAVALALVSAHARMGEPSQPLMMHWSAGLGFSDAATVASKVRPETQIVQSELYDSYQQFLDWKGAACSAAATSEILTAWGVKGATIGRVIDLMGTDISQNGGLISEDGFQRAASHFGYRADIRHDLSYKQILYLTNYLSVPVIVNVRISYGYYHFFDTGHFLVVTGGDDQGVSIVDSSTYYIHYLPLGVFFSMFTGRTALIVPSDYHYTLPAK